MELSGQVSELTGHIEVLRIAIDDLRQEVEHAIRNLARPAWTPTQQITSLPKDPLAPDFGERINRFTAADLLRQGEGGATHVSADVDAQHAHRKGMLA